MAFDGIVVAALRAELSAAVCGGYLSKIVQSAPDEILLTIKKDREVLRLLLSANAGLPLAYLTDENRPAPAQAPNFCMFLRKYIGGGRILAVEQPGLERALHFLVEHRNELGDLCSYRLILELMGKHSNLIFCDREGRILEAIKHIPFHVSSVREVLPGREYFLPQTKEKHDPAELSADLFFRILEGGSAPLSRALVEQLTGISPVIAEELCCRAGADPALPAAAVRKETLQALYEALAALMKDVKAERFSPEIYFEGGQPVEFSAVPLSLYREQSHRSCATISEAIRAYYTEREKTGRMRQRSADLRQVISAAIERTAKKLDLQQRQLRDTEKRDKYRIYGELLNTYGYSLRGGEKELVCENYFDEGRPITIPLDADLSARENAARFFERYNKLKRTAAQLASHTEKSEQDLRHLESILASLSLAESDADLAWIRRELVEYGYLRARGAEAKKKRQETSGPLHFRSSSGHDIYVGKNNYQNEEVTFRIAGPEDWWFHAKGIAGSHVVVCSGGETLPDSVFEEAGRLAAYYSKARLAPKVEIDYTLRKNLRKTTGGPPGFVIYHTNWSLMARPEIADIKQL